MTAVIDTSVLVDVLRGHEPAVEALTESRRRGRLHASEVTRLEILAGMRPQEEERTRTLLAAITFHPLDETVSEIAATLGREWLPSHSGIDAADLAIAATAELLGWPLLTTNVRHFPMFAGLEPPY